ncbi:MAG: U32 family peptidase C-terminal domain-containing protein, partial [Candidatus Omnitrophota bacterium]
MVADDISAKLYICVPETLTDLYDIIAPVKNIELLMPAGNLEKLRFALAFGADAVYLGMPSFSLRARENGFKKLEEVAAAVHYAHSLGKKAYVTANIFPHNSKISPCITYIGETLKLCQPDAWIMSDPGLIMLLRENYPREVIHLSVQANTVNYAAVSFWHKIGVTRIILSRELHVNEIKEIREHCPVIELESFVHGAICIAYSGRCLISSYLVGRDSNQGTCTNSCRWQYRVFKKDRLETGQLPLTDEFYLEESERPGKMMPVDEDENGTYLMNAKDLCLIEYLNELMRAGLNSFKIEGRSKSVYYVAMIARAYRRAIDDLEAGRPFDPQCLMEVLSTSSRGLTTGFLHGNPGAVALNYDSGLSVSSRYRFTGIVRDYDPVKKMMKVEPRNPIYKGSSYELCLPDKDVVLTIEALYDDQQ